MIITTKHGCMMYPHTTQRTFLSMAWKPPILLHCNLETICEGCCAWSGTQDLRCSQLVTCGEMKPKWISMRWKKCSQIGNWFSYCARGPEPGGMYFPKNLEFYWGASGDWTWRHFCKKDMHWPRWIKLNTYSPIQATDCHKWTVILWYLHLVQVQLPWENPAMASSFTSTRMDEETSGCSYLGVANSNSEPLLQKSEAFH